MKKLQNLGKSLSKQEQKMIIGGYMKCSCTCSISRGSWTYDNGAQPPNQSLLNDIAAYCKYGGNCNGCTNWV